MRNNAVIPAMEPESSLFNKSCHPHVNPDTRFTSRPGMTAQGFTLIELLVVVLIIGILAAVALPQYERAVWKSRYIQLMAVIDKLSEAQEVYYMANGFYDPVGDGLAVEMPKKLTGVRIRLSENGQVYVGEFYKKPLFYVRYQKGRVRQCRVLGKDEVAHRVCASLTGVPFHTNANDLSGFSYYRFP